jgi:hypothetical protein
MSTTDTALAILKTAELSVIIQLVDAMVGCFDDPNLTDTEAEEGAALFEELCRLCPAALPHNRPTAPTTEPTV